MESGVWVQQHLDDILVLTHCPATLTYVHTPTMARFHPPPLMMPSAPTPWPHFFAHAPYPQLSAPIPRQRPPSNSSYRRPHITNTSGYEVPPRIRLRLARMASGAAHVSFDRNNTEIQPQQVAHSLNRRVEGTLPEDYISDFLLSHTSSLTIKEEIVCTICQDNINEEGGVVTLNCRHTFHANCIKNWLKIKNQCPNCRASAI